MLEAVGEVIGMGGARSAVVGWTVVVFVVAFTLSRLPGFALVALRGYRELRRELRTPTKTPTKQKSRRS